jgi:Protein of unknown function (DUF4239)
VLEFLFDIPLIVVAPALILAMTSLASFGLGLIRRLVLRHFHFRPEDAEFCGAMLQAIMVFYGLAVALIAVNGWQKYSDTETVVSQEATAIAALYRDVSNYPAPVRAGLQETLREYTDNLIHEAWPLMRKGRLPAGGVLRMDNLQALLTSFEPATEGQKILHAETLRAYNRMIECRRMRLDAVRTALPGAMWAVVLGGAVIALTSTFFFRVEDARLHWILVTLLAAFMALVIFVVLAFDRPFRGDLGITPESYQIIYDQLMKR